MREPVLTEQRPPVPKPPSRLSDLIEMAIQDARSLDRSAYEPNAREWHLPTNGICMVCLTGAMIAQTMGEDPETDTEPKDYYEEGCAHEHDLPVLRAPRREEPQEPSGLPVRVWVQRQCRHQRRRRSML